MTDTPLSRTFADLPDMWEVTRVAELLRRHLPSLHERYAVSAASLFGSYVRNEQRPDSDLDVLLEFGHTPTLFDLVNLRDELSRLVGVPVDVVLRSSLQPRLSRYILREAVPL